MSDGGWVRSRETNRPAATAGFQPLAPDALPSPYRQDVMRPCLGSIGDTQKPTDWQMGPRGFN
jgi:hypothetical protein